MLFITAKDDALSPETAIFKVKERVEQVEQEISSIV